MPPSYSLRPLRSFAAITLVAALSAVCPFNSFAKDNAKPISVILSDVPAAELPAKAAQIVKDTKVKDREATTINVVKVAVGMNPAAAPVIVGAIAREMPAMAPVAAGTAATEQPKQACVIAKAAAAAAPAQAGPIVLAVCRVVPNDYKCVALAVSQAAPGSDKDILRAVAYALPDLKDAIEKALAKASANGSTPVLTTTLDQAARPSRISYGGAGGADYGLSHSPLLGMPGQPGNPGVGHDYSKPN
jgi:hypothetical protein